MLKRWRTDYRWLKGVYRMHANGELLVRSDLALWMEYLADCYERCDDLHAALVIRQLSADIQQTPVGEKPDLMIVEVGRLSQLVPE